MTVSNPSPGGGTSSAVNFTINAGANPQPTVSAVNPSSALAGSAAISITITGTNFVSSSIVHWGPGGLPNSIALATTFVNSTTLTAQVPPLDIQGPGQVEVSVVNPAPGGGTSNTVMFTVNSPVPVLTSLNPATAVAGSGEISIQVTGSGFVGNSQVFWNSTPLGTSANSASSITVQIFPDLLQSPGTASITVFNPGPGGGTSAAQTFTITLPPGEMVVNVQANSLAWDAVNQQIYLTLPSVVVPNGNSVQVLNPFTGALGANAFAGSEPDLLAVSSTSEYLYVGQDGASALQRFLLPALTPDITISLGPASFYGPYYVSDLQAAPNADGTVAFVRSVQGTSPGEEGGVLIYDGGVQRPQVLCGFIQGGCSGRGAGDLFNSIQWNANALSMYAANNEDTGFDFYTIPVTAAGFGTLTDYSGLAGGFGERIHFDPVTQYVYDDDGAVINPTNGTRVGMFAAGGLLVPDGTLNRAFFLGESTSSGTPTFSVESFNMQTFTPIATLEFPGVVGTPTHFIRWGTDGLAFTTTLAGSSSETGQVYLIRGTFVNPASTISNLQSKPTVNVRRTWQTPTVLTRAPNPEQELVR